MASPCTISNMSRLLPGFDGGLAAGPSVTALATLDLDLGCLETRRVAPNPGSRSEARFSAKRMSSALNAAGSMRRDPW
jgi:hypothetical protein